jgi:hypothetical protein
MYFVSEYEYRTMKPVEIVLRDREAEGGRMTKGVNLIKTYC